MTNTNHGVFDSDACYRLEPARRTFVYAGAKKELVKGDHNSERLTFLFPRYIDGHDMSLCDTAEIHYRNIENKTKAESPDVYIVRDLGIDAENDETVRFSWLVSGNATRYAGITEFTCTLKCTEGGEEYVYNTAMARFSVLDAVNNGEEVSEGYSDVLEGWKNEVLSGAEAARDSAQVSAGSAEQAALRAEEAVALVDDSVAAANEALQAAEDAEAAKAAALAAKGDAEAASAAAREAALAAENANAAVQTAKTATEEAEQRGAASAILAEECMEASAQSEAQALSYQNEAKNAMTAALGAKESAALSATAADNAAQAAASSADAIGAAEENAFQSAQRAEAAAESARGYADKLGDHGEEKLTKVSTAGAHDRAYAVGASGEQTMVNLAADALAGAIPMRGANGTFFIGEPTENAHPATKQYADEAAAGALSTMAARKVNGKPLSSDITLSASDVGAKPADWSPSVSELGLSFGTVVSNGSIDRTGLYAVIGGKAEGDTEMIGYVSIDDLATGTTQYHIKSIVNKNNNLQLRLEWYKLTYDVATQSIKAYYLWTQSYQQNGGAYWGNFTTQASTNYSQNSVAFVTKLRLVVPYS